MDKEGKEGQKVDNLHDQCVSHDVCRRGEKSSRNVEDSGRTVEAEDQSYSTPTTTSVQHDKNDGRRR